MKKIFITGGGGYVGSMLSSKLIDYGYEVTIYDLMIYKILDLKSNRNLKIVKGDIRDQELLTQSIAGHDIVIHLACISNDPSFELNPTLGKSINLDAFEPLVRISKNAGIKRFVYASSSSVYGIKEIKNVHENIDLEPITDYSKFKAQCEKILMDFKNENFICTVIRPATVCGYSKRQRLDVIVNILSNIGYHNKEISVFGGEQLRPNIHIKDMVRAYKYLIESNIDLVNGEIFNAGWENKSVNEIAHIVKNELGGDIKLKITATNDNRSYHISSEKIKKKLNFKTQFTINDAVKDLKNAFDKNLLDDPINNPNYFNIKKMQQIDLK